MLLPQGHKEWPPALKHPCLVQAAAWPSMPWPPAVVSSATATNSSVCSRPKAEAWISWFTFRHPSAGLSNLLQVKSYISTSSSVQYRDRVEVGQHGLKFLASFLGSHLYKVIHPLQAKSWSWVAESGISCIIFRKPSLQGHPSIPSKELKLGGTVGDSLHHF